MTRLTRLLFRAKSLTRQRLPRRDPRPVERLVLRLRGPLADEGDVREGRAPLAFVGDGLAKEAHRAEEIAGEIGRLGGQSEVRGAGAGGAFGTLDQRLGTHQALFHELDRIGRDSELARAEKEQISFEPALAQMADGVALAE